MVATPVSPTRRVGVFVHPWHTFGRAILRGLAAFAHQRPNWEFYTAWPTRREWMALPAIPLDGVVVRVGAAIEPSADFAAHLPRVVIGSHTDEGIDLHWDNHAIGRLAAEHLIEQGHRFLVFVSVASSRGAYRYQAERAEGFLAAASGGGRHAEAVQLDVENAAAVEAWLASLPRPAGVVAATDPIGHALLLAARHLGREAPEEIAVLGIGDDEEFCELITPPMSSVVLPGVRLGFEAAVLLERLMAGQPRPAAPLTIAPTHVTVRRSTDLLAVNDPLVVRALTLIRDRAADGITAAGVVRAIPLSRRALELRFRNAVGRPIEDEIRRIRVQRAQRLLQATDLPMPDIAERSGFPSAQRLSAVFSRLTGEPPTAYRARVRGHRSPPLR